MVDVRKLQADYLWKEFTTQFSHSKTELIKNYQHAWYLSPVLFKSLVGLTVVLIVIRKVLIFLKSLKEPYVLLELIPPSFTNKTALSTQQFFSGLYNIGLERNFKNRFLGRKTIFSFEIVSTLEEGIRYIVRTTPDEENNLTRNILAYLPQVKVNRVKEYLPDKSLEDKEQNNLKTKIEEYELQKRFGYPLAKHHTLTEHDPVAYLTGQMTKLSGNELVAFQIVISPTHSKESEVISWKIYNNEDILSYLNKPEYPSWSKPFIFSLNILVKLILGFGNQLVWLSNEIFNGSNKDPAYQYYRYQQLHLEQAAQPKPVRIYNTFEQEIIQQIQQKVDQHLFEASIRLLVSSTDKKRVNERLTGFKSPIGLFSLPKYQCLVKKRNYFPLIISKIRSEVFRKRLLSFGNNSSRSLLSSSEIADLYHFPFRRVTQTENLVKSHSKELPAPLSLKNGRKLDIIFGKNTYGGATTLIGLIEEERQTHMYILGRTGSGKSTLMLSLAKCDIEAGRGLAFIDPHGDISLELLSLIPLDRKDDLVYFNPLDLKYPIHINLLELTPGLDEDEAELEKEVVCEGLISLFKHVFSRDENANAHRIEYILRNTIYTAFTVKDRTIFTIGKILRNPQFRKDVIKNLRDEDLIDFWKYEFGKAGDYQVVKMTQGVTAKVGRFFRSPTARRILEHPKSTISFDDIINAGKILICRIPRGQLGEDTAKLLGTMILTKLQQAALNRASLSEDKRKPFYLYVDEFQNFATQSFAKMVTENRKYRMPLIIAEQSTSQQVDRNLTHNILANVTNVICFRSGNFYDEELMLNQFDPYVEKGDITNLSRYHFFIKISGIESEDPFSGMTIKQDIPIDQKKIDLLVKASRDNWAVQYVKPKPSKNTQSVGDSLENDQEKGSQKTPKDKILPDEEDD